MCLKIGRKSGDDDDEDDEHTKSKWVSVHLKFKSSALRKCPQINGWFGSHLNGLCKLPEKVNENLYKSMHVGTEFNVLKAEYNIHILCATTKRRVCVCVCMPSPYDAINKCGLMWVSASVCVCA